MTGPVVRILLRVVAGALIYRGLISAENGEWLAGDADVAMVAEAVAGPLVWVCAEGWYFVAKRAGWPV